MRLAAGLLLVGLWGCIPELQPPSSGQPTTPSVQPTSSVIMEPTVSPQPSSVLPVPLVSAEVWAGHPEQEGFTDGQGKEARFNGAQGLELDKNDNLYVVDMNNHRIRKIDTTAKVSTWIGNGFKSNDFQGGFADGPALQARLNSPRHLLYLPTQELWFDDGEGGMIRKLSPDGVVSTVLSGALLGKNYCGGGEMTLGPDGHVYVATRLYICRIEANGQVTKLIGNDINTNDHNAVFTFDGPAKTALVDPSDLVFTPQGEIYVSDSQGAIRKISKDWSTVTTIAGDGKAFQDAYQDKLLCMYGPPESWPKGATPSRNVDCVFTQRLPRGYRDGPAKQAQFFQPEGIVLDPQGNLYIADSYNHAIRKLSTDGIVSTVVRFPDTQFPQDIVRDKQGNFYVSTGYAIYRFRVP